MSRQLPFLAMDGVLCDYSLPLFGGKAKRENKTMPNIMTSQEVESHTKKLVARLLGQDAAMDDETAGKLKEFLKTKLSPGDHAQVCDMLEAAGGEPGADAQDTEPAPDDVELPKNAIGRAADARTVADFNRRFPDAAKINIDSSGIQPRKRPASGDMASFNAMFPDAAKIKVL
jgi:hypothetical protein